LPTNKGVLELLTFKLHKYNFRQAFASVQFASQNVRENLQWNQRV